MPETIRILVIDDDASVLRVCVRAISGNGWRVDAAGSPQDALRRMEAVRPDIVLTDLCMPGMDGMEILRRVQPRASGIRVILMTGHGSIPSAVEAMKLGAWDYITKPFDQAALRLLVSQCAASRDPRPREGEAGLQHLVGDSPVMQAVRETVLRFAPALHPVLITGESGTGKEVVARALHACSGRAEKPFVPVDCGGITPTLMESELFGHVKGAYTGATQNRTGLFATAADGAIFLDEIGELPPEMQVKLLRALQEKQFRPVGCDRFLPLNARVIAATNLDLEQAMVTGRFRKDLFFRLNVLRVRMPALRERRQDIPALADGLLRRIGAEPAMLTPAAKDCLAAWDWPGNVRELDNVLQSASVLACGGPITPECLPPEITGVSCAPPVDLRSVERRAIEEALQASGGNRERAARLLGVAKTTVYRKLREYHIATCLAL